MKGSRTSPGASGRGLVVAVGLSGAFLGLVVLTSPLVAALVVIPASLAVGALLAHTVPRAQAHCLVEPTYASAVVVAAPKVSAISNVGHSGTHGAPSAA
jgi:hypothetical protein